MGGLVPSPFVVILNKFVFGDCFDTRFSLEIVRTISKINSMEVVIFGLIPVREIPENTNVLKGKVVPFIVVWIIWNLIVMDIFSSSEYSSDLDELPRVYLSWPMFLVSKVCWNPASIDNDSRSFNFNWITVVEKLLERNLTTFITVKWVDYIIAVSSCCIFLWDQNFFSVIKLS
jgi:hypothetical protein